MYTAGDFKPVLPQLLAVIQLYWVIVICTKLDLVLLELASWNFHVKHQHLIYMHSCVHVHEKPQLSYVNYLHFSLSLQKKTSCTSNSCNNLPPFVYLRWRRTYYLFDKLQWSLKCWVKCGTWQMNLSHFWDKELVCIYLSLKCFINLGCVSLYEYAI